MALGMGNPLASANGQRYVLKLSDGTSFYATGDTSTTDDMRNGTLAAMQLDYAFWCSDGVYNMGLDEAPPSSFSTAVLAARSRGPASTSTPRWTACRPTFVDLTEDELARLEGALDGITVYGHRGFTR